MYWGYTYLFHVIWHFSYIQCTAMGNASCWIYFKVGSGQYWLIMHLVSVHEIKASCISVDSLGMNFSGKLIKALVHCTD